MPPSANEKISGRAAGVPFVAIPPANGPRAGAPVVVAWHLLEPPCTEGAFAAAVPLDGLDAWRIYLGLPMSGSRLPAGGWPELMRLSTEDAVLNMHRPVIYGAAEEFGAAWPELKRRLGLDPDRIGVLGGSIGTAAAELVLAEGDLDIAAAVLISPVVRLRDVVSAMARRYGIEYSWSNESNAIAARLDFVARSDDIIGRQKDLAILYVVGEQDDPAGFHDPATLAQTAFQRLTNSADRFHVVTVPDMAHALAEAPGTDPAPQTPHAAAVDHLAVDWFRRHLVNQ